MPKECTTLEVGEVRRGTYRCAPNRRPLMASGLATWSVNLLGKQSGIPAPGYCVTDAPVCLSLCSSRDLSEPDMKMEVEGAADGQNFSSVWSGLLTR